MNLADTIAAEDKAEDAGRLDGDDRTTCHAHQAWVTDCVSDPSHTNPVTGYNWCRKRGQPVQVCRCRKATVNG
jgi:hypothetical protein